MSGRSWFLLSLGVCAVVSAIMIYLGLFFQSPLSQFEEQESFVLRDSKKDVLAPDSLWNPEHIRMHLYRADDFQGFEPIKEALYTKIVYYPQLQFRSKEPDFFSTPAEPVALWFRDRFFLEDETELGFRVGTPDIYELRIDGKVISNKERANDKPQKYASGYHSFELYLYHPVGAFDLLVDYTRDGKQYSPYKAGIFSSFEKKFGADRTAFSMPLKNLFVEGKADFTPQAKSHLDELWFLSDEGRYWGRIVVEVHNRDGGLLLSQKRALKISKWLVGKGMSKKMITVQGYAGHWLQSDGLGQVEFVLLH